MPIQCQKRHSTLTLNLGAVASDGYISKCSVLSRSNLHFKFLTFRHSGAQAFTNWSGDCLHSRFVFYWLLARYQMYIIIIIVTCSFSYAAPVIWNSLPADIWTWFLKDTQRHCSSTAVTVHLLQHLRSFARWHSIINCCYYYCLVSLKGCITEGWPGWVGRYTFVGWLRYPSRQMQHVSPVSSLRSSICFRTDAFTVTWPFSLVCNHIQPDDQPISSMIFN